MVIEGPCACDFKDRWRRARVADGGRGVLMSVGSWGDGRDTGTRSRKPPSHPFVIDSFMLGNSGVSRLEGR